MNSSDIIRHYFVATAAIYVPCWIYPWLRTLFEYGISQKAQLYAEENGFIRITIQANFTWTPGQHCFLRFHSFGLHSFSSHPFTICSLPSAVPGKSNNIVFYVRPRGGLTARLHKLALNQPGVQLPALVDGPYGGVDNQKYFNSDRLLVIAGGSGAGWILPMIEQFLLHKSRLGLFASETKQETFAQGSQQVLGPQSIHVILATRDVETRTWFETTLKELLSEYTNITTTMNFRVEVHLTGEAEGIVGPSSSLSTSSADLDTEKTTARKPILNVTDTKDVEIAGRPDLPSIIRDEAGAATIAKQTVGVFACGPLSMQNDIRNAVAEENLKILRDEKLGDMYLHLEHFSWA